MRLILWIASVSMHLQVSDIAQIVVSVQHKITNLQWFTQSQMTRIFTNETEKKKILTRAALSFSLLSLLFRFVSLEWLLDVLFSEVASALCCITGNFWGNCPASSWLKKKRSIQVYAPSEPRNMKDPTKTAKGKEEELMHTLCLLQTCCHKVFSSFLLTGLTRKSAAPFNMHFKTILIESCDDITAWP